MTSYFPGEQPSASDYPQVIDMTLTSGRAPAHLDLVGGSPELADDARVRLLELERLWLDDDAEDGLACLRAPSRRTIAVSPETLLLLAFAETLRTDRAGPLAESSMPRLLDLSDLADRSVIPTPQRGSVDVTPRLDFAAMTVTLEGPVPDSFLSSLRSWSSGLTVDLVMADLIEGGAWGARVSVGGVVRTFGIAADGGEWTVTVLAPDGSTRGIRLGDGAVASSTQSTQPTVNGERSRLAADAAARPDGIIWSAVRADMAWEAQVLADGLVGLDEQAALDRLSGTAEAVLLYRRDGRLHQYPTRNSPDSNLSAKAPISRWRTVNPRVPCRLLRDRPPGGS